MAQNIPIVVADVELQISTAIGVGDTTFSLASANDDDGNALTAGKYCFTLDNGKSNKEYLIGQLNGTDVTSVVSVSRKGVESSGAAQKHRVGASCIITDFATIQRVADILRGEIGLDGASPIVYDAEPSLSDRKELATVGYVLDNITGGTVAFDAQTVTGTAGEAVADGDLVYFKTSDQEWYLTDADTAATVEGVQLGIALGTGSDGVAITGGIQISGTYTTSGLTAGSRYYASDTAGGIGTTEKGRIVGTATSTTKLLLQNLQPNDGGVPVGTLLPFAGSTAPNNFLLCYGQAVSRATYANLFDRLGTTYGSGDGSTTFNIPDLRGRVIAGIDNLGGSSANTVTDVSADSLGGTFGAETHTLTVDEMPSHFHTVVVPSTGAAAGGGTSAKNSTNGQTDSTGGGGAHNNMQPTLFMSYIIRAL